MFERCIYNRIIDHLSNQRYSLQYGFQSGKSTTSQMLYVPHEIHNILEKRAQVDIVYLDFAKAFDKVSHDKLARNKCNDILEEAKIDYYHRLFAVNKGNSKEIWNTINELMSRSSKSRNISSLLINKKVVTNNNEIAECLNQYFAEIGSKLANNAPQSTNGKAFHQYVQTAATGTMFILRPTTSDEVIKLISSISDKKATGLDPIPCKLFKLSAPIVSKSLCDIFNLSIQTALLYS